MNLVLTTFGTYLHRRGEMFVIRVKEQQREVSSRKVRSILITTGASLSTDAVELALECNIDLIFLDKYGDPLGRVWHGRPGSTTAIRRAQLRVADTPEGLELARGWLERKVANQVTFLEQARSRRTRLSADLSRDMIALKALGERLGAVEGRLEEQRTTLLNLEAQAGRVYWKAVNRLLAPKYRFEARSRNPARDEFNCLLNYAYGVLYGTVERACVLAGLDPYVGFVHTDHYNKTSLVFDLIECYRIWADETVVGLFAARLVRQEMFDRLHNGLTLNREGKAVLMERFEAHLEEGVRHGNRNVKRRDTVQLDCHRLANSWVN